MWMLVWSAPSRWGRLLTPPTPHAHLVALHHMSGTSMEAHSKLPWPRQHLPINGPAPASHADVPLAAGPFAMTGWCTRGPCIPFSIMPQVHRPAHAVGDALRERLERRVAEGALLASVAQRLAQCALHRLCAHIMGIPGQGGCMVTLLKPIPQQHDE